MSKLLRDPAKQASAQDQIRAQLMMHGPEICLSCVMEWTFNTIHENTRKLAKNTALVLCSCDFVDRLRLSTYSQVKKLRLASFGQPG